MSLSKRWLVILLLFAALPAFGQYLVTAPLTAAASSCAPGTHATACLFISIDPHTGTVGATLAGTWAATQQFEGSADGGTTWVSVPATPAAGGSTVTSATADGTWTISSAGYSFIRIRTSAWTSGSATATLNPSQAVSGGSSGGGGSGDTITSTNGTITVGGSSTATTLDVVYGTAANTAAQGNDSRITGAQASLSLAKGTYSDGDMCTYTASGTLLNCNTAVPTPIKPVFASYTFNTNGTTVNAVNNATGAVDYTGTDLAAVRHSVVAANATVGGYLYYKIGVYPINSMTAETATGCSNFQSSGNLLAYALDYPSVTPYYNAVQWIEEGEGSSVWQGEGGSTSANTQGVVFNITSTAVSSVAANSVLAGFWQRPVTDCSFNASNDSNNVWINNITVRFPTNQRGNTIQFANWFTGTVSYHNDTADFALPYNSIATGSAPVVGSYNNICFTSSVSSSGNVQHFDETYATGCNIGYDMQSEHIVGNNMTAIYNNYAGWFGRSGGTVYHPSILTHFVDQENKRGFQFGSLMAQGSQVDLLNLDIEELTSGTFARVGEMSENTNCNTFGTVSFVRVLASVSTNYLANPFTSGGNCFTLQNAQLTRLPLPVAGPSGGNLVLGSGLTLGGSSVGSQTDAFSGSTLSSNWTIGQGSFSVSSGAVETVGGTGFSYASWNASSFSNDQCSQVIVGTLGADGIGPTVREATNNLYGVTYSTPNVQAYKIVSGTATNIGASSSAPTSGQPVKICAIGTNIWVYVNGIATASSPIHDTSLSTGAPGISGYGNAVSGTLTNWTGTNVGGSTIVSNNGFGVDAQANVTGATYNTLQNCASIASPAVCGSAAAGSVLIPTGTTSSTLTVNTTAVTANSQIVFYPDDSLGTRLSTTCNSTLATLVGGSFISARVPGTSFTITFNGTILTNGVCGSYIVVN